MHAPLRVLSRQLLGEGKFEKVMQHEAKVM